MKLPLLKPMAKFDKPVRSNQVQKFYPVLTANDCQRETPLAFVVMSVPLESRKTLHDLEAALYRMTTKLGVNSPTTGVTIQVVEPLVEFHGANISCHGLLVTEVG
jgi:hypothetical protein